MKISLIAAVTINNVIGKKNALPWYLPADLKHFREITTGHHIIMGKNTYMSIGKPLPNRMNIVLDSDKIIKDKGVIPVSSIEEALKIAVNAKETEVFFIGGAMVFNQALPLAKTMYLTKIKADIDGDIYFPEFKSEDWNLVSSEPHMKDGKNKFDYEFRVYKRKNS